MPETILLYAPLLAGASTIVGAVIGATITYFFVVQRKVLEIAVTKISWIKKSKDIPSFALGGLVERGLHTAEVQSGLLGVKNIGNVTIKDIVFLVVAPGHAVYQYSKVRTAHDFVKASVTVAHEEDEEFVRYQVSVDYLNPGEAFGVDLVFQGANSELDVFCRLEGVKSRVWREAKMDSVMKFALS